LKNKKTKIKKYSIKRAKREYKKKYRNRIFRKKRISQKPRLRSYKYLERFKKKKDTLKLIEAKPNFTILEHINNVIDFVCELKSYAYEFYAKRIVFLDLSRIEKIDIGAICIILSTVEELSKYSVQVKTNLPLDKNCRDQVVEANFIPHLRRLTHDIFTGTPRQKQLFLITGNTKTEHKKIGSIVKQATQMITGKEKHYQPVYSLIQEINGNSIEHAYENKKDKWLLGINHDVVKNKVIFTFADNGQGILKTLKRKLGTRFFDSLQLKNNIDILKGAFDKKYSSRHEEQVNRNKGLPLLKKIKTKGQVNNLLVITNDVYLRLDNNSSIALNTNFSGTFYYWELDAESINNGERRNN
jgi:hypothetical protein